MRIDIVTLLPRQLLERRWQFADFYVSSKFPRKDIILFFFYFINFNRVIHVSTMLMSHFWRSKAKFVKQ